MLRALWLQCPDEHSCLSRTAYTCMEKCRTQRPSCGASAEFLSVSITEFNKQEMGEEGIHQRSGRVRLSVNDFQLILRALAFVMTLLELKMLNFLDLKF